MKNKFQILIILVILSNNYISSQNKFNIGIGGGINYSSILNIPEVDLNSNFSYLLNLNLEYSLKENWSIKSGIGFEKKATILNINNGKVSDTYNYIIVPLLLKYNFGKSNDYFLNGGAFSGYLLSRYFDKTEISEINNNNLDFGVSLGFGKNIRLSEKNTISLEIRNNLGIISNQNNEIRKSKGLDEVFPKTNSVNFILNWNFIL